jgi:hypothetical protein
MSINLQGLRTAGYKVGNLSEAKAWYTKALGIKPYRYIRLGRMNLCKSLRVILYHFIN